MIVEGRPTLPLRLVVCPEALTLGFAGARGSPAWGEGYMQRLETIPGHQLSLAAMATFGEPPPVVSFPLAVQTLDPATDDPYGIGNFHTHLERIRSITAHFTRRTLLHQAIDAVGAFLPAASLLPDITDIFLFLVPFGHPFGDAYVRRAVCHDTHWHLTETGGTLVILMNLSVVAATYSGTPPKVAQSLIGVLAHELFHIVFHQYQHSLGLPELTEDAPALARFAEILLDEGAAHYLDRLVEAHGPPTPFPRARATPLMTAMEDAMVRLARGDLSKDAEQELLARATVGPYWDKFGSVGGSLLITGVVEGGGRPMLQSVLSAEPLYLLAAYRRYRPDDLPPLGETMDALASEATAGVTGMQCP